VCLTLAADGPSRIIRWRRRVSKPTSAASSAAIASHGWRLPAPAFLTPRAASITLELRFPSCVTDTRRIRALFAVRAASVRSLPCARRLWVAGLHTAGSCTPQC
jgi:hypothetical protein